MPPTKLVQCDDAYQYDISCKHLVQKQRETHGTGLDMFVISHDCLIPSRPKTNCMISFFSIMNKRNLASS